MPLDFFRLKQLFFRMYFTMRRKEYSQMKYSIYLPFLQEEAGDGSLSLQFGALPTEIDSNKLFTSVLSSTLLTGNLLQCSIQSLLPIPTVSLCFQCRKIYTGKIKEYLTSQNNRLKKTYPKERHTEKITERKAYRKKTYRKKDLPKERLTI